MKWLITIGLLALCSMVSGHVQPTCEPFFVYNNGSCYRLTGGQSYTSTGVRIRLEGMPFMQANTYCKTLHPDAHLVVINDAVEHAYLFDMFYGLEPIETWVGLFYNATTLAWEWINGDPAYYQPWEPFYGEPLILAEGGAVMFMSEVITAQTTLQYGYGLECSDYLVTEMREEPLPFICEYSVTLTEVNTTFVDTNTTATPNTTSSSNTTTFSPYFTNPPPTMAPQVLFQQNARPMPLSNPGKFGFMKEVTAEDRKRARPAYSGPMAYNQRGPQRNNGYPYMAFP
nr:30 kDa spicule matrix protein-like [Lytechinus pictus]